MWCCCDTTTILLAMLLATLFRCWGGPAATMLQQLLRYLSWCCCFDIFIPYCRNAALAIPLVWYSWYNTARMLLLCRGCCCDCRDNETMLLRCCWYSVTMLQLFMVLLVVWHYNDALTMLTWCRDDTVMVAWQIRSVCAKATPAVKLLYYHIKVLDTQVYNMNII